MNKELGARLFVQRPVVLLDLNRYDARSREVIGKPWNQEVCEIGHTGIVAYEHQVVEAVVLCNDDIENVVQRRQVEAVVLLQELPGVVERPRDDFCGGPGAFGRTRHDQRGSDAMLVDSLAHNGRIALAAFV